MNRNLLILFSVIVIDLVGFGIVIPILPFYAKQYGAGATVLGLILSSYSGMQFLFSPFWGRLSDRIGRRRTLLITILGGCASLVLLGTAGSLFWIFIARIAGGLFAANIGIATAYVADVTPEEERARGMGLIGAAFGIGFILGPVMGGLLSRYGYGTPILAAAFLSVVNAVYAFFRLEEPVHNAEAGVGAISGPPQEDGTVRRIVFVNFLFTLGITQLESVFAFFMMDRFRYDASHVAYLMAMMAVISVAVQGGAIRRLARIFGETKLLLAGSVFLVISFAAIPEMGTVAWLVLPLGFASLGRGISQPSLFSLVSKEASPSLRGVVMGRFQSAASLARTCGPGLAGILYDRMKGLPFWFAGLMLMAVVTLSLPIRNGKASGRQ